MIVGGGGCFSGNIKGAKERWLQNIPEHICCQLTMNSYVVFCSSLYFAFHVTCTLCLESFTVLPKSWKVIKIQLTKGQKGFHVLCFVLQMDALHVLMKSKVFK